MKLNIQIGQEPENEVILDKGDVFFQGKKIELDIWTKGKQGFHVLKNGKSYQVEVRNGENQNLEIGINGKFFPIRIKDSLQILLDNLGMSETKVSTIQQIKAPMPGMILKVMVDNGASVKAGEPLLILEAMKMENIIKASSAGFIQDILIKPGQKVEKGQSLVTLG